MITPRRLGHIVLKVKNLNISEKFYVNILNLKVTYKLPGKMIFLTASNKSHELGLMKVAKEIVENKNSVGLYHFAWEMKSFKDLKLFYNTLKKNKIQITGIGDHGISIGVYFLDPDGYELETFYELPQSDWPKNKKIFSGNFPLGSLE